MTDFDITDVPTDQDMQTLRDGFAVHARQNNVTPYNQHKLALFLRNDNGTIIAGASGFSVWNNFVLEMLWVDEKQRGKSLATKLMMQIEAESKSRGCNAVYLWTANFQAPKFYSKLGYTEMSGITLPDAPTRRTYFMKRLAA